MESLLCSSRVENIRLAGQLMHCSKVQGGGAPSRRFPRAFLCTVTSDFFIFETLTGQRGRPRQSVLPGQRLRPQGRLRQQRGPGAGRCQRVLQLVGHPEGFLHGSSQVSHWGGATSLHMRPIFVILCVITPQLQGCICVNLFFFNLIRLKKSLRVSKAKVF